MWQIWYLAGEEILPFSPSQIIQQAKFRYSPLGEPFKKQSEKQTDASKSSSLINKIELQQTDSIFLKNYLNDFITDKLKEMM